MTDPTPLSSTLTDEPGVIDGNKDIAVEGTWDVNEAYGVDFGSTQHVDRLVFSTNCTGTAYGWRTTDPSTISIYKSNNNSTWTLISSFACTDVILPPVSPSPGVSGKWYFTALFSEYHSARYFKAVVTDQANVPRISTAVDLDPASNSTISLTEIDATVYDIYPENVSLSDDATANLDSHPNALVNTVALSDTISFAEEYIFTEEVAVLDTISSTITVTSSDRYSITESGMIYETLGLGWIKDLISTAAITDTVTAELGLNITEYLPINDAVVNNWTGTENVISTLGMFGQSIIAQLFDDSVTSTAAAVEVITYLHQMVSIANSTMAAADTSTVGIGFNPTVAESIAVTGLLSVFNTINKTITESPDITDTIGLTWPKAIADTFAIADAPTIQWVAMHILTDSLVATETAIGLFNFSDTISDTLEIAAAAAIQQALQESVSEILDFGITILLDDEVWECWVMNGNKFNMSVYSGFSFNSYTVYDNIAYGCKEDGIYRLDGTTDNGTAISSGVVFPETDFGSMHEKRFRKAYFGISGTSPSIRMETDTADVTYTITSSKANIQRNQKGKEWTLKVSGFDDMDFIELIPIVLTR